MPPIRLTDSELDAVMSAARPLDVSRRDAFLQRVADELGRCNQLGPAPAGSRTRAGRGIKISLTPPRQNWHRNWHRTDGELKVFAESRG